MSLTAAQIEAIENFVDWVSELPRYSDEVEEALSRAWRDGFGWAVDHMTAAEREQLSARAHTEPEIDGLSWSLSKAYDFESLLKNLRFGIVRHGRYGRAFRPRPWEMRRLAILLRQANRPDVEVRFLAALLARFPNERLAERLEQARIAAARLQ